ncbi:MAG: AAA family ATPase [Bacteroidia bacterium]|nr:AAA family ATPase [Bacteroidia bacterium]
MLQKNFNQIWDQLRAKKSGLTDFLENITIRNFRGIAELSVNFDFPVAVIAGANATGKTTVLLGCGCAYRISGDKGAKRSFSPTKLFPNLHLRKNPEYSDKQGSPEFEFYYISKKRRASMRWAKGASWSKSYMGQQGASQPERLVYLRTLANLTSPSEVRSVLQIGQKEAYEVRTITSDLIAFAQRVLPHRYDELIEVKAKTKNLLYARRNSKGENQYSEFHMSAGERALLHISKEISQLKNALILIDEVEAGLHPYTQQQFMLELQRLALRNDLQIVVTTHSPVILECVPVEGRIFLERTDDNVVVKPAYRDIIQKAFYGQSLEKLSLLCEDDVAESFLMGVLDVLNPRLGLLHNDVVVGRDTGKEQFSQHIEAIGKFQQLDSFVFVLDGDAKSLETSLKTTAQRFGTNIQPLFLPGVVPEAWAWDILREYHNDYASLIGLQPSDLLRQLDKTNQAFDNAADKATSVVKNKFFAFCETIRTGHLELMRKIAKRESERQQGDIKIFVDDLEIQVRTWQARK